MNEFDLRPYARRRLLAVLLVFCGFSSGLASAGEKTGRPNIVLLMADEFRHDALGCAGNNIVQTPNLDRLASQGARFARTYCQGPLCQPSRASLITGQYVHRHGISNNRLTMDATWPTMMKQLQQAGYTTAMLGKAHFTASGVPGPSNDFREASPWIQRFGFDYLLEEFDRGVHIRPGIQTPYTAYLQSKGLLDLYRQESAGADEQSRDFQAMYAGRSSRVPQEHNQTSVLGDRSVDWLRAYQAEKPFFLWVSFIAPHPPLIDDPTWAARYKEVNIPPVPSERPELPNNAYGRYLQAWMRATGVTSLTPAIVQEAARHYYGMVSLVDQKIGDIVAAVEARGWGDNTWFFFTADHGEMLGEHGLMFKNVFYKGSVLVPNVVRPAGGMATKTVSSPTESIDITATILDVAGTRMPTCQGQSLLPLISGKGKPREVAFSELGLANQGNFFVMAATERYRYLYDKKTHAACELFDLEKDPDERHNLVNDPNCAAIRRELHEKYVLPFLKK